MIAVVTVALQIAIIIIVIVAVTVVKKLIAVNGGAGGRI